jgi:hypothetical protein
MKGCKPAHDCLNLTGSIGLSASGNSMTHLFNRLYQNQIGQPVFSFSAERWGIETVVH